MKKKQLQELAEIVIRVRTKDQALALLKDLLTPEEIESICERLQIFKSLNKKISHRAISKTLKVSISKVTRGSHALKISKSGLIKKIR